MKRKFLLSIALALTYSVAGAHSLRQIEMENDTLNRHLIDLLKATTRQKKEYEVETCIRYNVPKTKFSKLSYYITERELRKACYNYIYSDSIFKRVRCKLEVDSVYRDSINTLLIPVKGNRISGDNISLALRLTSMLKLDDAQYQYLMDKALSMARHLNTDPRYNVWNEEMNVLRQSLSPDQLTVFFQTKNAASVTKEIDTGWQKIVDAGLSEQLDSATEIHHAYAFYHERQKIKDLYRYYGTSQKKYLAELNKNMPPMVKMLETLDKQARLKEDKKNKTIGKEFVW